MAMPPIEAPVSAHCLDPLPNRNVTNSRPTRPECPCESGTSFRPGQESDHRHRRLLPPRRERPRCRRAAECGQQLPPSDGDCHTPLPREVRKGNDTTPRACSLHVQGAKIEPKTTSTNGWLRAERDGGLTPRLGNSLASRIDLAPNNRLRSRSRRSRRGGLRGCLRPAAKRATASETDHAASLKKIVWISRRRSRSIHSRRVRITPRFGRVGRCKRPSPSRTACLPCASRPGRLPRCPIHGTSGARRRMQHKGKHPKTSPD